MAFKGLKNEKKAKFSKKTIGNELTRKNGEIQFLGTEFTRKIGEIQFLAEKTGKFSS